MSLGKYSPTVSMWYANDQDWYEKNGGYCSVYDAAGNVIGYEIYDKDGYDSYGYHKDTELDRAGNSESDYLEDSISHYNQVGYEGSVLYEDASCEWAGKPVPTCPDVTQHGKDWVIIKR